MISRHPNGPSSRCRFSPSGSVAWRGFTLALCLSFLPGCPDPSLKKTGSTTPLAPLLELGVRDSDLDTGLVAAIRDRLSQAHDQINIRNLGLRPLLLLDPRAERGGRTYVHDLRHADRTYFANFGEHGFLLARLRFPSDVLSQSPIEWATLHINRDELPRARRGLYASFKSSTAELPEAFREIASTALEHVLGPAAAQPPLCRLVSVLRQDSFDLFEHEQSTCALTRAPRDERFPNDNPGSKVLCIQKEGLFLLDTRLDKVQFALPTADGEEVIFYEGSYSPPRISRLNLSTLKLSEAPRPVTILGDAQAKVSQAIPEVPLAIYACGSAQNPQTAWLLEEADVAKGIRLPSIQNDRAWFVTDGGESGLLVDARRWTEAVPPIDSLPPPRCILEPEVDALCGLTMLRKAVTLAGEILKGELTAPELRAPVLYTAFLSLHEIERGLGGWLLEQETAGLLELFGNEILVKEELHTQISDAQRKRVRQRLDMGRPQLRTHDTQERVLLRTQIGAPDEFWNVLLGSETIKGQ